jgi:hypothetical protein
VFDSPKPLRVGANRLVILYKSFVYNFACCVLVWCAGRPVASNGGSVIGGVLVSQKNVVEKRVSLAFADLMRLILFPELQRLGERCWVRTRFGGGGAGNARAK